VGVWTGAAGRARTVCRGDPHTSWLTSALTSALTRAALAIVSATAGKCIKTGKMKMRHFSGIKFAAVLTEETHSPLSSHEIRRKRTRRQNFSLDAQEENHPFSHCRYSCSFRSPLTPPQR